MVEKNKNNVIEIIKNDDSKIIIKITRLDGIIDEHIYQQNVRDIDAVEKILKNKYYQAYKGDWECIICEDGKQFFGKSFELVMNLVYDYIQEKDIPYFF